MNKHLSEIRAQIQDASAATRFDKMRDEIIKKFLIFYPFKLREMTDEFPFQLNMLITTVAAEKNKNCQPIFRIKKTTKRWFFITKNRAPPQKRWCPKQESDLRLVLTKDVFYH